MRRCSAVVLVLALGVLAVGCLPDSSIEPPPCNCSGPDLDCRDFATHAQAQACYEYCKQHGYGDAFGLDADKDGIACESPW